MSMSGNVGLRFWISFCAEVLLISVFWPAIILLGISLTGIIEHPISMYVFVPVAIVTGVAWFLFRVRGFKRGKYYLNDL